MQMFVDGNNMIHRLYHAMPMAESVPAQLCNWLRLLQKQFQPDFVVALDTPGDSWRGELVPQYKASRAAKPLDLLDLLRDAPSILSHNDFFVAAVPGHEADDILATWARNCNRGVIVSSDKDLYQCLRPECVTILRRFKTHQGKVIDCEWFATSHFADTFGLVPPQWPHYRALVGDPSDGTTGVKGIGPKAALELLQKFCSIEDAIAAIEQFKTVPLNRSQTADIKAAWSSGELQKQIRIHTLVKNVPMAVPQPVEPQAVGVEHATA